MSTRQKHAREVCMFRALSSPEGIALKNQQFFILKDVLLVKILLISVILFYQFKQKILSLLCIRKLDKLFIFTVILFFISYSMTFFYNEISGLKDFAKSTLHKTAKEVRNMPHSNFSQQQHQQSKITKPEHLTVHILQMTDIEY